MRFVVIGEDVATCVSAAQPSTHLARQMQLLLQPQRHRLPERAIAGRRERQVGFQQSLELRQRLVVEADVVQVSGREPAFLPGSSRWRAAGSRSRASCA